MQGIKQQACILLLAALPAASFALQSLSDGQLSNVTGRDGITATLTTHELSLKSLEQQFDANTDNEGRFAFDDMSYTPVTSAGALDANPATLAISIDAGKNTSGKPALGVGLDLSRVRFNAADLAIYGKKLTGSTYGNVQKAGSFGELSMDAKGELYFANLNGMFNSDSGNEDARLYGKLSDTSMYYRQIHEPDAPYLLFDKGTAMWNVSRGSIGVVSGLHASTGDDFYRYVDAGMRTLAPFIDVEFLFNYRFKQPVTTDTACNASNNDCRMTTADSIGMYSFGWTGTFTDTELVFGGQGLNGTQGIGFASRMNYLRGDDTTSDKPNTVASDVPSTSSAFTWSFGMADAKNPGHTSVGTSGDEPLRFDATDWRNLPGIAYAHEWPYIGIDVVNQNQGPGMLCWGAAASSGCTASGAKTVGFAPTGPAVALVARDGNLRTYSERIRVHDSYYDSGVRDFDWGLIYTFANADVNLFLYPQGNIYALGNRGITADIAVISQTLDNTTKSVLNSSDDRADNWSTGSHLLIADTAFGNAIGMMDQSFMLLAQKANIMLKPLGAADGSGKFDAAAAAQGGLDVTAAKARFELLATFGGRDLPKRGQSDASTGWTTYPAYYDASYGACSVGGTCPNVLVGGVNSWNYEGFLNLRVSPPPNDSNVASESTFLGYSLAFRATSNGATGGAGACATADATSGLCSGEGTFFATAEPSQQGAKVSLGGVTGDMAFINGKVELIGTSEEGDHTPKLRMSHTLLVGLEAQPEIQARADAIGGCSALPGGSCDGQVFRIGDINFNGNHLGEIVVPRGQFYGVMALRPQLPVGTNGLPL